MMIWKSILIAFSMFSAIPVPQTDWEEESMRYSLCAFPLVGVVIGLLSFGWGKLCMTLALPDLLRGAGYCLIPVLSTGGIHLDGYADTWDALSSHAGIEKKQEILKDPHLGAFAGIRLCMYFAASLALWCALPELNVFCLLGLYGQSRCLSGIALMSFPLRAGSGLARVSRKRRNRQQCGGSSSERHWFLPACLAPLEPASARWRRWRCSGSTGGCVRRNSAGSPAIWRAGSSRRRSSGCSECWR